MEWHRISDGLPPMGVPLIVTVKDNLEHKQNKVLYPAYYEKKERTKDIISLGDTEIWHTNYCQM